MKLGPILKFLQLKLMPFVRKLIGLGAKKVFYRILMQYALGKSNEILFNS